MTSIQRAPIDLNHHKGLIAADEVSGEAFAVQGTSADGAINVNATVDVSQAGAAHFAYGQVSIGDTATQIVGVRSTRRSVTVVNLGTTDIYIGDASVTTSTGQLLLGAKGAGVTLEVVGAVYGIITTGSEGVSFEEEYD